MQTNSLRKLLPSSATFLALLLPPILLSIYLAVTQYSDRFITEQNVNYADVQNNILGKLLLNQQWIEWFNRAMDFAIWGLLAAIVLLVGWALSSIKVSLKNHYTEEGFTNFHQNIASWHGHYFTILVIKIITLISILFCIFSLIGKQLPRLSVEISQFLQEKDWPSAKSVILTAFYMYLLSLLIVVFININKFSRSE